MTFTRTSEDATTHNMDACCGEFVGKTTDVPEPELDEGVVYCYARCANCGALWRDGFLNGHVTNHSFEGRGEQLFETHEFDWEFSHIDTNKLHDGRATAVYTPTNDPMEDWLENGYITSEEAEGLREVNRPENYRKEQVYVFRFCELDTDTAPAESVAL
jgi:hypothetical protein